jgi:hypothetical protein
MDEDLGRSRSLDQSMFVVAHEALFTSWDQLKIWINNWKQVIFLKNRLADDSRRYKEIYQSDVARTLCSIFSMKVGADIRNPLSISRQPVLKKDYCDVYRFTCCGKYVGATRY